VPLLAVPQPTNGITYFRALASLHTLPEELQPYVPLFAMVYFPSFSLKAQWLRITVYPKNRL